MSLSTDLVSPWGATLTADGVLFRLWAPDVDRVQLVVENQGLSSLREMQAQPEGWWEVSCAGIGAGSRYQYRLPSGLTVPDPASRFQPLGCHGASEVIDPQAYPWRDAHWSGRPWHEAVIYELHVGTFTPEGTFAAAIPKLARLAELGITAIELLPLATCAGKRNWGYDGVLPFAPDNQYGRPEELKALIDAAHAIDLMVFLDVVYNHFGPEGNYLGEYAQELFTTAHHTPWGPAINYDQGSHAPWVRRYTVDNVLYWLEEYHFDGLRLDAVHSMIDTSSPHILTELATAVAQGPGSRRHVHIVLENDDNEAHWLTAGMTAQWNDDFHHVMHHCLTGERDSYYQDYADRPMELLGRTLAEGFAYQGQPSAHREGRTRGECSRELPVTAFVNFLQNHDQIGNRAFGERLHHLCSEEAFAVATAIQLLAPAPPLLFMGQEWCASSPFLYFCDFDGELKRAVTEGRRKEFAQFAAFSDPSTQDTIPDPNAPSTFTRSKLDWSECTREPHASFWRYHQRLLQLRQQRIQPLLQHPFWQGSWRVHSARALQVTWKISDHSQYTLLTNLGGKPWTLDQPPSGECLAAVIDGRRLLGDEARQVAADSASLPAADHTERAGAPRSTSATVTLTLSPWAALFFLDLGN